MNTKTAIAELRKLADPNVLAGLSRYGIVTDHALGITIPKLRALARRIGVDHELAQSLWATGIHDARILASMVDDPSLVTVKQMDCWVRDFDSWDVCDLCCSNLFDQTRFAWRKAIQWSKAKPEYVKRAGFVMMAALAVHDKQAEDAAFGPFFDRIEAESGDERNFVKKAVNWALRQIGKRNRALNRRAVAVAESLAESDTKSARWIGKDALRELKSDGVQRRLRKK